MLPHAFVLQEWARFAAVARSCCGVPVDFGVRLEARPLCVMCLQPPYLWQRALSRALSAVVHPKDKRSWQEPLMLPEKMLDAPARGGRKHKRARVAYTLDRP